MARVMSANGSARHEADMSGGIVGDAIGAAIGVEGLREAGALGAPMPADGHACLNCGAALTGPFCQQCGQAAHVHRTLMAFVHDLLHGVFHFEGRVWRTIPMLMARPGVLTREYVSGRRVRYVSPIALFLFSIFLLFAVVTHVPEVVAENANVTVGGKSVKGLAANVAEVARLKAERARLAAAHQSTEAIDDEIENRQDVVDQLKGLNSDVATQVNKAFGAADKSRHYSDIKVIDTAIAKARANPDLALYKLQSHAYKYSWALIPLSVPLVWLLFPFSRRFGLYDHTVFVTYSLCAMSLMVVVISLMQMLHLPGGPVVATFYPLWHMYRQVKDAYGLSRFGAVWRTGVLAIFAMLALTAFTLVLAMVELAG
jgi:hypothetical protein